MRRLNHDTYVLLRDIAGDDLPRLMEDLSDASVAIILMNLPPNISTGVYDRLPEERRQSALKCLVDLDKVPEKAFAAILVKVEKQIETVIAKKFNIIETRDRLAEMVCNLSSNQRMTALSQIQEQKRTYFNKLKTSIDHIKKEKDILFFEDVLSVRDEEIQLHIRKIDFRTLAIALADAPEIIRQKLVRNLSGRIQEVVEEEIRSLKELEPLEVEAAQDAVLKAVIGR